MKPPLAAATAAAPQAAISRELVREICAPLFDQMVDAVEHAMLARLQGGGMPTGSAIGSTGAPVTAKTAEESPVPDDALTRLPSSGSDASWASSSSSLSRETSDPSFASPNSSTASSAADAADRDRP